MSGQGERSSGNEIDNNWTTQQPFPACAEGNRLDYQALFGKETGLDRATGIEPTEGIVSRAYLGFRTFKNRGNLFTPRGKSSWRSLYWEFLSSWLQVSPNLLTSAFRSWCQVFLARQCSFRSVLSSWCRLEDCGAPLLGLATSIYYFPFHVTYTYPSPKSFYDQHLHLQTTGWFFATGCRCWWCLSNVSRRFFVDMS